MTGGSAGRKVLVRFLDGPLAGQQRALHWTLVQHGYRHPIEQRDAGAFRAGDHVAPGLDDVLVAEYRTVSRLEAHDLPGLPPETVLAEMRMSKPPQVRAVERLLNEWRARYGMTPVVFGDS